MRAFLFALMVAVLAGCAAHPKPGAQVQPEIQAALQERPAPPRQRPEDIERVQEALLPPLAQPPAPAVAKALEPRFDLSVQNAPAQQVFLSIASGTRYSMLVHPDVAGSLSVNLKDVTVIEALQAIREIFGYDFKLDGNRIYVLPLTIQTRVFHVNYLVGQRVGRSDVRVTSGSVADVGAGGAAGTTGTPGATAAGAAGAGAPSDSSRVQTSVHNDFWNDLATTLTIMIGCQRRGTGTAQAAVEITCPDGRNVVVNPQASVVVVRALPTELRNVEAYLRAIRLSVERQVMLEAKIIEVTLNAQYQAGVNWAAFPTSGLAGGLIGPGTNLNTGGTLSNSTLTSNPANRALAAGATAGSLISGVPGGALFGLAFQTQNFAALLQFLESQGSVQVLSSPRIAAMNNQKSVLKVGTDEFFITNISGTAAAAATTTTGAATPAFPTLTLRPFFSGVALDITPQIDADSNIILHIHPSVSDVRQQDRVVNLGTTFGGAVTLPLARSTVSESDSIVKVADGNIVAIGGLMKVDMSDDRSGVPGLQDNPVVGGAFGSRTRTAIKKELIILIKPTVIQSERDWDENARSARERVLNFGRTAGNP